MIKVILLQMSIMSRDDNMIGISLTRLHTCLQDRVRKVFSRSIVLNHFFLSIKTYEFKEKIAQYHQNSKENQLNYMQNLVVKPLILLSHQTSLSDQTCHYTESPNSKMCFPRERHWDLFCDDWRGGGGTGSKLLLRRELQYQQCDLFAAMFPLHRLFLIGDLGIF